MTARRCPSRRAGSTRRAALAAALLAATPAAARPPTRIAADFAPAPCAAGPACVAPSAALGALAFNTPILYGRAARADGITCAACHAAAGVSGAAAALTFDRPIPDLAAHAPPGLPARIAGLIQAEFDGPPPAPFVRDALAAYVAALPRAHAAAGLPDLLRLAVELLTRAVAARDLDRAAFIADATRAMLGEAGPPDALPLSRALHRVDERADAGDWPGAAEAAAALPALLSGWPGGTLALVPEDAP